MSKIQSCDGAHPFVVERGPVRYAASENDHVGIEHGDHRRERATEDVEAFGEVAASAIASPVSEVISVSDRVMPERAA